MKDLLDNTVYRKEKIKNLTRVAVFIITLFSVIALIYLTYMFMQPDMAN